MIALDLKKLIINFSVLFYFFSLAFVNQFSIGILFWVFYVSLVVCAFVGVCSCELKKFFYRTIMLVILLITGMLNHCYVGNETISSLVFLVLYFYIAFTFCHKYLLEKTLLLAVLLNVAIICFKFITVGLHGQLFTHASNNFVSVYLMYPTVVYYSIIEKNESEIKLFPISIVWILSLLARGRGGILTVTMFLVFVYFLRYRSMHSTKKIVLNIIIIIIISIVMINIHSIIKMIGSSVVMEQFSDRGGFKSSRTFFWSEYINNTFKNKKCILLGTETSRLIIGWKLGNNPHNSFLEIHMANGLLGLIIVLFGLFKSSIKNFRMKNYLFIFCMIFALSRAFTDHVLWNSYGTPILFFLIFYEGKNKTKTNSFIESLKKSRNEIKLK